MIFLLELNRRCLYYNWKFWPFNVSLAGRQLSHRVAAEYGTGGRLGWQSAIGESVSVRVTRDTVEVFFHGNRVAVHPREASRKRDPLMVTSHMPENHRQYLTYTEDDFQSWASTIGPNTEKVVCFFLESGKAPEQGFKSCASLKKYADRYKAERIEEACRQILLFSGAPSIRGIQALLKTPVKKDGKTDPPSTQRANRHRSRGFTRGAEQFREGGDEK